LTEARACRLVVMPEWQGAGVGMRFLNHVCQRGSKGRTVTACACRRCFTPAIPGCAAALRRDPHWTQVSAMLHGDNKLRSAQSMARSGSAVPRGHGGHFRAVQGFRYYGLIVGQKLFGAATFELVTSAGHEVVAVHAPAGDRLRAAATSGGVPVLDRPGEFNGQVDLIIAAHCHAFIGPPLLARSRFGGVGYHPSLLPIHRGRDAVRWALHMRERVTGGTVYWLTDRVDGGDIAAQQHVFIRPEDTPRTLWERELFPLGLRLLRRVLNELAVGRVVRLPQDEAVGTWEPAFARSALATTG
jgi:methionyl-tRNA formyltransferase